MANERLNDFLILDKPGIVSLFAPFAPALSVLDFSLLKDNMSNSGYIVTTSAGPYLLKLYSNTTDRMETAMYAYLKGKINVPELLFYDGSKQRVPYAYAILEFLEGTTLRHHLRSRYIFQPNLAYEIGRMLGVIHSKSYPHDALLDAALEAQKPLPGTQETILNLLHGNAGAYLKPQTREALMKFLKAYAALFDQIDAKHVLCHGDFNFGNIMVSGTLVHFIDFEFAHAGPIYQDIGQFFRRKGADLQALIDDGIYKAFADGYDAFSCSPLPPDWLQLARLCDISSMLRLINRENVPNAWVADIETDILHALHAYSP